MAITTQFGYITSKELADSGDVSLSTIQYYTAIGLLHSDRRAGNKRLYESREARARLKQIQKLRQGGFTLAQIRQQLNGRSLFK